MIKPTYHHKVLENLSKAQVRIFITLLVITASILLITSSYAEDTPLKPNQQKIQYNVFAGGIHALKANLIIDLSNEHKYDVNLSAKTYGLLGKLAPWEGTFASHGWKNDTFKPQRHESTSTWKKEKESKEYSYNKDGTFNKFVIIDNQNNKSVKSIDKKLTDKTTDILTSTLNTLKVVQEINQCDESADIFDGKRRYQLVFKHKKNVILEKSKYNAYQGPAIECTIEVKPVTGKWHQKPRGWLSIQEQGREQGSLPTIWIAKTDNGSIATPVKVRVKTSYGVLFMQMTNYESMQDDGMKTILKLEK